MKNRDNEMAELTSEVSDLIPISEKLKEENESLKTEVAEGNQERIDMLGKFFETSWSETLKKLNSSPRT